MIKLAHWFTIGVASAIVFTAGCSDSKAPTSSTTQPPAATAEPDSADVSSAEGLAEASPSEADEAKPTSRVVEKIPLQPGSDPLAVVFASRQPNTETVGTELIKVAYPTPEKAVVTITKTGLPDDSVAATRTRYEFRPVAGSAEGAKQWELVQVSEQNKCQPTRGSQDWTGDLCQ